MSLSPDGTVFAIVESSRRPTRTRILRWTSAGVQQTFAPRLPPGSPRLNFQLNFDAVVARNLNDAYVTMGETSGGAIISTFFWAERWTRAGTVLWKAPACATRANVSTHIYAVASGDRLALTLDPSTTSGGINFDDPESVQRNLPTALIVERDRCTVLGRAVVTDIAGSTALGFRGYLDARQAPWNFNLMVQRMVALRWINGKERSLGAGVPFATNALGIAVGASALPGHQEVAYTNFFGRGGTYQFQAPHALAWRPDGTPIALAKGDQRSVAWDVAKSGTIVGTEQLRDGKHYAFRWRSGRLQRLNDLPHPPGWRFESAYAIGSDGSIVGIGTHDGVPTVFVWHG